MSKIYIILVAAAAIIQTPVFAASKDATTYESASNGSELKACINLGVLYRHGDGVARDDVKAPALYRRACDGGKKFACGYVGDMLYRALSRRKITAPTF